MSKVKAFAGRRRREHCRKVRTPAWSRRTSRLHHAGYSSTCALKCQNAKIGHMGVAACVTYSHTRSEIFYQEFNVVKRPDIPRMTKRRRFVSACGIFPAKLYNNQILLCYDFARIRVIPNITDYERQSKTSLVTNLKKF